MWSHQHSKPESLQNRKELLIAIPVNSTNIKEFCKRNFETEKEFVIKIKDNGSGFLGKQKSDYLELKSINYAEKIITKNI